MIDMTNGSHVYMGFRSFEFFLGHCFGLFTLDLWLGRLWRPVIQDANNTVVYGFNDAIRHQRLPLVALHTFQIPSNTPPGPA